MIAYSGTKSRFHSDVISNDIAGTFANAGILIPNAEAEEFMVVAEVAWKCAVGSASLDIKA